VNELLALFCPFIFDLHQQRHCVIYRLLKDSLRRQRSTYMMGRDSCMYSQVLWAFPTAFDFCSALCVMLYCNKRKNGRHLCEGHHHTGWNELLTDTLILLLSFSSTTLGSQYKEIILQKSRRCEGTQEGWPSLSLSPQIAANWWCYPTIRNGSFKICEMASICPPSTSTCRSVSTSKGPAYH
jgi:hypothetical protein